MINAVANYILAAYARSNENIVPLNRFGVSTFDFTRRRIIQGVCFDDEDTDVNSVSDVWPFKQLIICIGVENMRFASANH